jgi:Tn3 transposase DDE domain
LSPFHIDCFADELVGGQIAERASEVAPHCNRGARLVLRDEPIEASTPRLSQSSGTAWDSLYASLQTGHVTAAVALRRLVGYGGGKNRFYRANRDLGRVLKTEFILQYLSEPALRGRIRRSLLKVEQLDALARDVFYGRRGRINARELWEQMNTLQLSDPDPGRHRLLAGAGNLAGLKPMRPCPANGVDLSLLEHVSPIE